MFCGVINCLFCLDLIVARITLQRQPAAAAILVKPSQGTIQVARRVLAELSQATQSSCVSPYRIAAIYSALQEYDAAASWLQKADARRD